MSAQQQRRYGVSLVRDVMVAVRDGIRLATDLYRPALDGEIVEGSFPTILCRTPDHSAISSKVPISWRHRTRFPMVVMRFMRDNDRRWSRSIDVSERQALGGFPQ